MQYRRLGSSGLKVSALSFGSWLTFHRQMDAASVRACMKVAYDSGVNFFDNAEAYGEGRTEEIMGKILKGLKWGRDTYSISSKVFWGGPLPTQRGLCRKHVVEACHNALRRFGVDYLDLYFCHRPDPETPIEETVRAMHDLVTQGKVLYWGTSEWSAADISRASLIAREQNLTPPTMEQPEYNLFHRNRVEVEYLPLYRELGLGTTIWSPLASGILTGKYSAGIPKGSRATIKTFSMVRDLLKSAEGRARVEKTARLQKLAAEIGTSVAKLSIAWCLTNPNVSTVILGASKPAQLKETLGSLETVPLLTNEVLERIEAIVATKPSRERVATA